MRLILLTALTMIAFAANSLLNRLALVDPGMGPAAFAAIRLASGAFTLLALVWLRRGGPLTATRLGTISLALYILGFSFAYVSLPAGVGALILFGGVQITMFAGAVIQREQIPGTRWLGAGLAFGGLAFLLWPSGAGAPAFAGSLLMGAAALGWGIYSLVGRHVTDPLATTAGNFLFATPVALIIWLVLPDGATGFGAFLAVLSGVVTSGLGYALWYSVLPRLGASTASVTQLVVPVIAMAMGIVFLGEALTVRFMLASVLVLGGIALSLRRS